MLTGQRPTIGLRERKKIKTRAAIQQHAVRLFREQGYQATTVEQIAEAAEISPSTFFRYFPTKEAVVVEDDYDPLLIQAFQAQPAELTPLQAMRNAVKTGVAQIPEQEFKAAQERMALSFSVPELRAASLNQMMNTMRLISELAAERAGRDADDFGVLAFAGAVVGAFMGIQQHIANHPEANFVALMDEALSLLESGLRLDRESSR